MPRFEASVQTILAHLASTAVKMQGSAGWTILLGERRGVRGFTDEARRSGFVVQADQLALYPVGAGITFRRKGVAYGFRCARWESWRDNLRACQQAVSWSYRIVEDYGVTSGSGADESFERIFGGHRLALAPENGRSWWFVLGVEHVADEATVKRAYRRLAQRLHPDKPGNGDSLAMVELNAAYAAFKRERGR